MFSRRQRDKRIKRTRRVLMKMQTGWPRRQDAGGEGGDGEGREG